jgi:hypothetical protein
LLESSYGPSLIIGVLVMLGDALFHLAYSSPFETWTYFFAKFFFAFLSAFIVYNGIKRKTLKGALYGSVLFGIFTTAYYYYANFTGNYSLTCCPYESPQIQGFPSYILFMIGTFNVTWSSFGFLIVHMFLFFVFYAIVAPIGRHFLRTSGSSSSASST